MFRGTVEQAKYPYVGTLADIMQRPSLYDLTPAQRQILATTQQQRSAAFNATKSAYGLDIGEFPVEAGGVHLPNVDVSERALAVAGDARSALFRGRTKERFYATAADRWAHDANFRPETNVSHLFAANDSTLARASGKNVLVQGLGGKTRLEVMQETHPQLAAKMAGLQTRLQRVKAAATKLGGKQAETIDDFLASPLDEADLTTLQADLNPTIGANAVGRQGVNFGKDLNALRTEIAAVKQQLADLRPAWRVANLKPYVFVQEGIYRYFPAEQADQVRDLLKASNSSFVRFVDKVRATAFGGDLSPLSIQGATAWLSDPIGSTRFAMRGGLKITRESLLRDMEANPESWKRFVGATGINPLGGVEKEFATGFIENIPKVGKGWAEWNEALYRPITKLQKDVFDGSYQAAVKRGLTPEKANAIAADDATKIIPRLNSRRLGQSAATAASTRAAATSVSFLTQPAALLADATKGLVKIPFKQTLTPSEIFAVRRVVTLAAATEAIAVLSNANHARTHELDVTQAVKDSLNPSSGKFMSLVLPNGARIGLGGPFRGILRLVWPRQIPGVPVPIPFAGLERFAKGRIGPAGRIAYDEMHNKDYYGRPIATENFPINILQYMEYALEGSAPLTLGSAAREVRQGSDLGAVGQQAGSQFAGTTYLPDDPVYASKLHWKDDFKEYDALPSNAREAKAKQQLSREQYRTRNYRIDAKLFIAGRVDSLSSGGAKVEAIRLMKENDIKMAQIKSLQPKDYDSDAHRALRRWFAFQLGEPFVEGKLR